VGKPGKWPDRVVAAISIPTAFGYTTRKKGALIHEFVLWLSEIAKVG